MNLLSIAQLESLPAARPSSRRPRLGFAGTGWIGRHRLQSVAESGAAEIVAIADPSADCRREAEGLVEDADSVETFSQLLEFDLDGIVIATPSALHARQVTAALDRGLAVFCQKPLARTAAETAAILEAAQTNDRLLSVDFSYRHVRGVEEMRRLIGDGELGRVYAADLTFHNAYGPDKSWFYDPQLSGGGCTIDLGIHLVDLALWMLDFPAVAEVHSRMYCGGEPLAAPTAGVVEDCTLADFTLEGGATLRLACSWKLPAGQDAVIEAVFYGTRGAVALRNVGGSFWDFVVERYEGTRRQRMAEPPDDWGSRAILAWLGCLSMSPAFDEEALHLLDVANLIDRIYQR